MTNPRIPTQGALGSLEYLGDGASVSDGFFDQAVTSQFFAGFDCEEISALAGFFHVMRATPGLPVIHEGGTGDYMLLVLSGRVDVLKQAEDGSSRLMATVGPGMTLGEMSMLDGEPRFATCMAIEATTIAVLTRDDMLQIIDEAPRLGAKILVNLVTLLSQRLRRTSAKLVDLLPRGSAA
ncbi:MAG TPA: cyclic nucleotide-binding domain-containing protein [Burkholderiales bacterium]|nr:cyclic nucleotide-binding domain-containing protein [Betaproteobacteria bacterium]HQR51725.1 cyclic nucleotide-binding domain-containing protein [Burkholderiales bacterium]